MRIPGIIFDTFWERYGILYNIKYFEFWVINKFNRQISDMFLFSFCIYIYVHSWKYITWTWTWTIVRPSSSSFRIPKVKKVSSTEKSSNIELEKASDNTGKEKLSDSSPVPVVDFEVANLPESRKRPIVDSAEKRNTKQLKLSSFFKTY